MVGVISKVFELYQNLCDIESVSSNLTVAINCK